MRNFVGKMFQRQETIRYNTVNLYSHEPYFEKILIANIYIEGNRKRNSHFMMDFHCLSITFFEFEFFE